MKKIILLFVPLLAFIACSKESGINTKGSGEAEVEMKLVATGVSTRAAIDEEDVLNDVTILVFDADNKYLYKRYAWKTSDGTFKSNLKLGQNLRLYFGVNVGTYLDGLESTVLQAGTPWSTVYTAMSLDNPAGINHTDGLPMWGQLPPKSITDQPVNHLGTVKLLRSVASTDVTVSDIKFKLEEVYLCFGADKGFLPYHPDSLTTINGEQQAKNPVSPSGMLTDRQWSKVPKTNENFVNNYFYMYENDTDLSATHTPTSRPTKIVVKGTWSGAGGSGTSTYYPLTFRKPAATPGGKEEKLRVTRNCKYIIMVTKVNGDGYGSLEEAKNAEDVNADYDVIDWNMNNDNDIFVDGSKYLSLTGKVATLYRTAGSTYFIPVTTNYTLTDILMKFNENDTGVATTLDTHPLFKIELKTVNGVPGFLFTAKTDYDSSATGNPQAMIVTVGRIKFTIQIQQIGSHPNDWENGGNQNEDL